MSVSPTTNAVTRAGVITGLGIGGFFDGIVLHQILQWHHLVSENYPPTTLENLQINTVADGLFHAATWIFTLIGIFGLWQVLRQPDGMRTLSTRRLIGAMLMGWGIFNLVEGIVDHHILQIHHVRSGPDEALWDIAFLVWGAVMLVGGWVLMRNAARQEITNAQATSNR